jgi:hypothetical protein
MFMSKQRPFFVQKLIFEGFEARSAGKEISFLRSHVQTAGTLRTLLRNKFLKGRVREAIYFAHSLTSHITSRRKFRRSTWHRSNQNDYRFVKVGGEQPPVMSTIMNVGNSKSTEDLGTPPVGAMLVGMCEEPKLAFKSAG